MNSTLSIAPANRVIGMSLLHDMTAHLWQIALELVGIAVAFELNHRER